MGKMNKSDGEAVVHASYLLQVMLAKSRKEGKLSVSLNLVFVWIILISD